MLVKSSNSKSFVIVTEKIVRQKSICIIAGVNHQAIPSIADNPVRFLGRTIPDPLSDKFKGLGLILNYHSRAVQSSYFFCDKTRAKHFQLH